GVLSSRRGGWGRVCSRPRTRLARRRFRVSLGGSFLGVDARVWTAAAHPSCRRGGPRGGAVGLGLPALHPRKRTPVDGEAVGVGDNAGEASLIRLAQLIGLVGE